MNQILFPVSGIRIRFVTCAHLLIRILKTIYLLDACDAHFQSVTSMAARGDVCGLLLHIEVGVRVSDLAHVGAFLLDTQPFAPICVLAMGASRVVALLASDREVVEPLS